MTKLDIIHQIELVHNKGDANPSRDNFQSGL